MKNMDNFYNGFAGERYIMSQLYKLKYEANKMDIDYGFDILATNHYRYTKGVDNHLLALALQVKTRTVLNNDYIEKEEQGVGKVIYAKKEFTLSRAEFNLITDKEDGFLLCMFNQDGNQNPLGYFWLSGKMLIEALNNGFIKHFKSDKPGGYYKLIAQFAVVSSINFLADHCINLIENSTMGNEPIEDLKLLLRNSTIIPNNNLSKIDLLKYEGENPSLCVGTLRKELTTLKNIHNKEEIQLFTDSYIPEAHLDIINTIQNKKFSYEESIGLYNHI